jgi:hypothetical protein
MNIKNIKSQDSANESETETFVVGQSEPADSTNNDAKDQTVQAAAAVTTDPPTETDGKSRKKDMGLPEELSELVYELRESVKQINPKKHTKKSLRRSLAMVNDILDDINRLTLTK